MDAIAAHENSLRDYAVAKLAGLNWIQVQGTTADKGAIFSFTMDGAAHAHDISTILDKKGVAVRAGQHCTGPLMEHLGLSATCRASFAMYNTTDEVDGLDRCVGIGTRPFRLRRKHIASFSNCSATAAKLYRA